MFFISVTSIAIDRPFLHFNLRIESRFKMFTKRYIFCSGLLLTYQAITLECKLFNKEDTDKFLAEAGCRFGNLLDVGVCTKYGYRPHITPKVENMTDTIVHTTILHQVVRDVDDKKGATKMLSSDFTKLFIYTSSKENLFNKSKILLSIF